ncbi:MAG: hypothetical protein ABFD84_00165 [Candidatus Polarisedimenticolia bacterium]|nr:hypothetical protein [bacterium]
MKLSVAARFAAVLAVSLLAVAAAPSNNAAPQASDPNRPEGAQQATLEVSADKLFDPAAADPQSGTVDVTFPEHLCDQATLVVLRFRPVKNVGDGRPGFSVRASVFVNAGDARAVELRLTLLRGTDEVGGGSIPWFRADANDISSKTGVMGLNAKDLAAGQGLKLKVLLFVRPLVP